MSCPPFSVGMAANADCARPCPCSGACRYAHPPITATTAMPVRVADANLRIRVPPGTVQMERSACKEIGRAGVAHRAVGLVAVDSARAAVFAAGADDHGAAVRAEGHRAA